MATAPARQEKVKLWHLPELGNLELMHATYITHKFPRHAHDGFAVGVIEQGALGFYYRGANVVASAGAVNLANPDEVHTGHAAAETGWTYRMFYCDAVMLRKAATAIAGRPQRTPFFLDGVIHDSSLAAAIHSLHMSLEANETTILEKESRFLWMLTRLISRHADAPPSLHNIGKERIAVKRVLEYMEAHFNENISLHQLAAISNLSPFHFIRVFRNEIGLPPHTFLIQLRIRKAKALLAKGCRIAATAYETGFVDQSHFSRHFKRITGITPGLYRKIVQDN